MVKGRPRRIKGGKRMGTYIDAQSAAAIKAIADATNQTESAIIRNAVSFYLQGRLNASVTAPETPFCNVS